MAYVRKLLAKDEDMIGIARLHWIYVIKGLFWFLVMAGAGWLFNSAISHVVLAAAASTGAQFIPAALMTISNGAMYFLMAGGFMIFFLFVLKVLVTEVALTTRRVVEKTGFLFVKVRQVDIEEVRGESLDLGHLGRVLGYGYLLLDCRFIGDVRLPAIENPERFLRALHQARTKTQDSLSLVMGKGNPTPVDMSHVQVAGQQPELPQPAMPPQPTPEIQPGQPGPSPEINPTQPTEYPAQPVPHAPPPSPTPPSQPQQPPPQPQQPIPAPPPSQPPLQPPTDQQGGAPPLKDKVQNNMHEMRSEIREGAEHLAQSAPIGSEPGQSQPQTAPQQQQTSPPSSPQGQQSAPVDAKMVAEVVKQVMPQMAQQVAQELVNQGVIDQSAIHNDNDDPEQDLITSFDDAALDKDGDHPRTGKTLEHAVH